MPQPVQNPRQPASHSVDLHLGPIIRSNSGALGAMHRPKPAGKHGRERRLGPGWGVSES